MLQSGKMIAFLGIVCLLLGGCGQGKQPDTIRVNTISVTKDGKISEYLVESFDREYYSVNGLAQMVNEEAEEYNQEYLGEADNAVSVEQVELLADDSSMVLVHRDYYDSEVYRDCTGNMFFYGTVSQAQEILRNLDNTMELTSLKKSSDISMSEIQEMKERHIVITDVSAKLFLPYVAEYVSQGLTLSSGGGVDTTTSANPVVVILMKK